jgi:hypothetical protein
MVSVAAGLALLAGCGGKREPDNTARFVSCLQQRGGQRITEPTHLDRYPSGHVTLGVGASLPSVSFFSIEAAAGDGHRRQALIFVESPRDEPPSGPMPEPTELLRRARNGETGVRALVLMPPSVDFETPLGQCEELAAPGQAFP